MVIKQKTHCYVKIEVFSPRCYYCTTAWVAVGNCPTLHHKNRGRLLLFKEEYNKDI